jgi:hypothetical protein
MQFECSDESVAQAVGLQSIRGVGVAVVEGREILGAATSLEAVEGNGDGCSITLMGGVRERRLRGVGVSVGAGLRSLVELRRQPLSFADYGRDPTIRRGFRHVVSVIEGTGRNGLRSNRRHDARGAGIANM